MAHRAKKLSRLIRHTDAGLQGNYAGSCIACMQPTDTGLSVTGEPEWHAAFLLNIGIPRNEAIAIVERWPAPDESDDRLRVYRVCAACAAKGRFPKPQLAIDGGNVPNIGQP